MPSTALALGIAPRELTVALVDGAGFDAAVDAYDARTGTSPSSWETGTTARLDLRDEAGAVVATWPAAAVTENRITFTRTPAQVTTAIDGDPVDARLWVTENSIPSLHGAGPVTIYN